MWLSAALALREERGPIAIITDAAPGWVPPIPNVEVLPFLYPALQRGHTLGRGRDERSLSTVERAVSWPLRERFAQQRVDKLLREGVPLIDRWRDAISSSRGVIFSGAGAINDDYAVHGIYSWELVVRMARAMGKPVLFVGQGLGPINSRRSRVPAAEMLKSARHVSVRSRFSLDLALELGVPSDRVSISPDWALALDVPQATRERAAAVLRGYVGDEPFIAVSIHRRRTTSRAVMRSMSKRVGAIVRAAHDQGRRTLFIPNMTAGRYSDDRATADLLTRSWDRRLRSAMLIHREQGDPLLVKAMLGLADAIVTTRYHPLVFALAEGTTGIGLSYDEYYDSKLQGAASLYGVERFITRFDVSTRELSALLSDAMSVTPTSLASDKRGAIVEPLRRFIADQAASEDRGALDAK
jgi:polysaccharide pyruvyl transferase WcaK-like protein